MILTSFLTGSRLYGIDTKDSDTDIRNIVLDSFHNVLFSKNFFKWEIYDHDIELTVLINFLFTTGSWVLQPFFIDEKYFLKPIDEFEKLRKLKHLLLNKEVVNTVLFKDHFVNDFETNQLTKHAVNTIRNCWIAEDILKGGEPQFTLTGEKQQLLLDIKAKNKKLEKVDNETIAFVGDLKKRVEENYKHTKLTAYTGMNKISKVVQEIYLSKWNSQ